MNATEKYNKHVEALLAKNDGHFGLLNQIDQVFKILYNAESPVKCYTFPNMYGIMNYTARISKLKRMYGIPIMNKRTNVYSGSKIVKVLSEYWIKKDVAN